MNPSDTNSSLATLRQLKEMLDAGALTPQEFDALKQKLLFGKDVAPTAAEPADVAALTPPVSVSEALTSAPILPGEASLPPPAAEAPDWLAAPAPLLVDPAPAAADNEYYADDVLSNADNQRNPLNLVFAIGGALVFLAVVLYLTLGNRGPDEHLTSTTQTAADSARVAPEVGPQAQQLTLPSASPETIRVAPVAPPAVAPGATAFRTDSAAAPAATAPAPTMPAATSAKPAAKPAPAPVAAAADTTI